MIVGRMLEEIRNRDAEMSTGDLGRQLFWWAFWAAFSAYRLIFTDDLGRVGVILWSSLLVLCVFLMTRDVVRWLRAGTTERKGAGRD